MITAVALPSTPLALDAYVTDWLDLLLRWLHVVAAIAWIGALVADLVVNKPLGLSPRHVEFKRAYLFDVNPVGVGAMAIASSLVTCSTWSINERSRMSGTNPAPIPWILCGAG